MTAPIMIIRTHEDLIEAFRLRKAELKLSNTFVDEFIGLTRGHTDKLLGPTQAKGFTLAMMFDFLGAMAIELHVHTDLEQAKRNEVRWEQRNGAYVRAEPNRVSKVLVQRAKPHVMKGFGQIGGQVRGYVLSAKHVEAVARKGGRARARKMTAAQRRESARKAGKASAAKRKAKLDADASSEMAELRVV